MQPAPDQHTPPDFSNEPTAPLVPQEQGIAGGKGLMPILPTIPVEPPLAPLPPAQPAPVIQESHPQRTVAASETTEVETTYVRELPAPETPFKRSRRTRKTIRFIFSVIEVLLVLRFFLKVFGADPNNPFGTLLYGLTNLLMAPFGSLLPAPTFGNSVLELTTLLALVIYPVFGWIVSRTVQLMQYHEQGGQEIVRKQRYYDSENG
jgi:YggT family protein